MKDAHRGVGCQRWQRLVQLGYIYYPHRQPEQTIRLGLPAPPTLQSMTQVTITSQFINRNKTYLESQNKGWANPGWIKIFQNAIM